MKNKKYPFLTALFIFFFIVPFCFGKEIEDMPQFTRNDRILILVPHPDDEAIGTAGVIQKALQAGSKVKVVLFTNGDNNELAFIVYEKRLVFRKKEFLHMGEVRSKESLAAMESLGLGRNDIIFLGYPDFGTMEIMTKYWDSGKPFRSMFTRITKVSYPQARSVNAPYAGESILKDLKEIILDFKPTKIFVSHPADTNRDHRSLYLFLKVALWDLSRLIKQTEVFPCIIHVVGWPKPRGYHPELTLEPPVNLKGVLWRKLTLADEQIKKKDDVISLYKSQIEYDKPYLFTFARKNELFGDYPAIKLKKQPADEISWEGLEVFGDAQEYPKEEEKQKSVIPSIAYAQSEDNLFMKITLRRKIDKNFGVSVFLLGYNKYTDFAKMPKVHLYIDIFGLHIKNKKATLFVKGVRFSYEGKALVLKIPLSLLGRPDYILSSARATLHDLPFSETAWRTIELE